MAKSKQRAVASPQASGPPWQASSLTYLAGRAHLDGVDALAVEMERKWGVGRLRLLVSPELRDKFDRQRLKFNLAIRQGDVGEIATEAARMVLAWRTLDEAAAGEPLSTQVWEVALPSGDAVVAIVPGPDVRPPHDGRRVQVWTLDEIARVIEAFPQIAKCKEVWPGATVEAVRPPPDDPLEHIDDVGDLFRSDDAQLA